MFRQACAIAALGGLLMAARPACAMDDAIQGRFDKTLNVSSPAELNISTGSGSIDIQPGGNGTIHIVGEIRAHNGWRRNDGDTLARVRDLEANPPIEQEGNRVRVGDRHGDDRRMENISISYRVTVPSGTSLVSSTGSGSQTIGSLAGPVRASSGSGSLAIGATGAMVHAGTGSGSIVIDGAKDRVEASTGSGSIRLRQIAGSAKASSGSGSIELEQTAKGAVDLNTASGQIRVRGTNGPLTAGTASGGIDITGKPEANWSLSSSSGSISLSLPTGTAFTLDARTTSGGLDIDHPLTISSIHGRHREVHGAVNGGGPTVSVETTSGSIRIGAR
jgi:DUF4097 and DUF4098 domain-containing protein YvlB